MAPTPSFKPTKDYYPITPLRTPQSKHRRLHFLGKKTPNPMSAAKDNNKNSNNNDNNVPTEHPVEVIGRIRNYPDRKDMITSALEIAQDGRSVRVRTDIGYRDFTLDGVSVSEDEDLEGFYNKFVESRIHGVKLGAKCTIMMYGPTGSGKSHTMFGSAKQPGIVYRALRDILGDGEEDNENKDGVNDAGFGVEMYVQITVLEIYNEEIYDLLSGGGGATLGLPKGNTPKVRLEVMGRKAKNASYFTGNEAGKISREVAKVEKRRIVKSTLCNERSSRSHCLIILDVPSVGGRLMLVDMAGSENIEQAGQNGLEAKMQTAKINQGNIALKRVVESIAVGDSHVPFRDSKLTMLLQDSFEDDKSKILMILCASPEPKEMHKTISTLEYGAKAKCIVRVAHMPTPKDKTMPEVSSSAILGSRITAMNQFIFKLQMENKIKEKERSEAKMELMQKEEELMELRAKLKLMEGTDSSAKEEEINIKVDERTLVVRLELEKMHEKMVWQQRELEMLKQRLEEAESQRKRVDKDTFQEKVGSSRFVRRLSEIMHGEEDQGIEKSMDMDMGMSDQPTIHDVKELKEAHQNANFEMSISVPDILAEEDECDNVAQVFPQKVYLSTVFEGSRDEEEEDLRHMEDEEVEKVEVEESKVPHTPFHNLYSKDAENGQEHCTPDSAKGSSRSKRIQNIFRLCGNYREIVQQVKAHTPLKKTPEAQEKQLTPLMIAAGMNDYLAAASHTKGRICPLDLLPEFNEQKKISYNGTMSEGPITALEDPFSALGLSDDQKFIVPPSSRKSELSDKENNRPGEDPEADGLIDVYVKWETTSKEFSGNLLKKIKVLKNATLADLRKLIETYLNEENTQQQFTFLLLGDPTGAPVVKNNEAEVLVSRLPICNNQSFGHLSCLRPAKKNAPLSKNRTLLCPLENKLEVAALSTPLAESLNLSYLSELRAP